MAAICWLRFPSSSLRPIKRNRCLARAEDKSETPWLLRVAVTGATEFLRIFSPSNERLDSITALQKVEPTIYSINDVVVTLQSDYKNAYFLTGNFTSAIYAEDCIFEDPTIKFRVPHSCCNKLKRATLSRTSSCVPVIRSTSYCLGINSETNSIVAQWKLRTYLKLPWKPLISIEGSTVYDLDEKLRIVRHAESWKVSALEAVGQIFTPSTG